MSKETKSLTMERIMNSIEALREIANEDLPLRTAVSVSKTIKEIEDVLAIFDESKKKLFDEYGEPSEEEGGIRVKEENIDVFNEKYIDLVKQEVDVDVSEVNVDDLGNINVKPALLMTLDWFISV